MKRFFLIIGVLLMFIQLKAQETYNVNGQDLVLKTEVEGELDLLWNIIDNQYRYFVQTSDGNIIELTNTKDANNNYQEEYKTVLAELTSGSTFDMKKLSLTLFELRDFLDKYNKTKDSNYTSTATFDKLQIRAAIFGGITNHPFVDNPENIKTALIGAELEIFGTSDIPRHSGYIQLRNTFENDDFEFKTTQISLGYRLRFIKAKSISIFGNFTFATLSFTSAQVPDLNNLPAMVKESATSFDVPLIFGLGADIRIAEGHFITLGYNELFALLIDNQGNFPVDFTIGYRFNL